MDMINKTKKVPNGARFTDNLSALDQHLRDRVRFDDRRLQEEIIRNLTEFVPRGRLLSFLGELERAFQVSSKEKNETIRSFLLSFAAAEGRELESCVLLEIEPADVRWPEAKK